MWCITVVKCICDLLPSKFEQSDWKTFTWILGDCYLVIFRVPEKFSWTNQLFLVDLIIDNPKKGCKMYVISITFSGGGRTVWSHYIILYYIILKWWFYAVYRAFYGSRMSFYGSKYVISSAYTCHFACVQMSFCGS